MRLEQSVFDPAKGWTIKADTLAGVRPQFALVFGGRVMLEDPALLAHLRAKYPSTRLILASTSGEITDTSITDEAATVTAVALEKSHIACAAVTVRSQFESRSAGQDLAARLRQPDLVHVFVVSDGQLVNGTELARGFNERLDKHVTLTGGLAGDGSRFEQTVVGLDEPPRSGRIVAIGFYGASLRVGFGSSGGWNPGGADHVVTRSQGNILFELDGQPALGLYKQHLGEHQARLPASALRFPLCVTPPHADDSVVRTILSVEEVTQSMVFAGDVPHGSRVRFMHASHADIVNGAGQAAEQSRLDASAELAICVSCVGRHIVLGERTKEEMEHVRRVLGPRPVITGFYSYGELAPSERSRECQLHNQTMTITTLQEG